MGAQAGARIARAQFFVSLNDGRSWTMGTVRSAGGGVPPPGHGAIFVAGGQGAWVALGRGSIWTSPDGRTWTLAPGTGLPLLPGDQISDVARTAAGFIAVGANVPGGEAARSTPLIFLSANGITWERLDAARLHLAAGGGRALDVRYVAVAGKQILIAGDVVTTKVTGKPRRTVTVQVGAAWLSGNGGSTWVPTAGPAAGPALAPPGPGAQPQVAGVAVAGHGFVLLRPATVAKRPAIDAYYSPNGVSWTFTATLSAASGLAVGLANGGPDGAAVTGVEGGQAGVGADADRVRLRERPGLAADPSLRHVRVANGLGRDAGPGRHRGHDGRQRGPGQPPAGDYPGRDQRRGSGGYREDPGRRRPRSWPSTAWPRSPACRSRWAVPTAFPPRGPRSTAVARGPVPLAPPRGCSPGLGRSS